MHNASEEFAYRMLWEAHLGRKLKASDISDEMFKAALVPGMWNNRFDVADRLRVPDKVALAKARTMIRKNRGVVGCYCGCRGDFELVDTPKFQPDPEMIGNLEGNKSIEAKDREAAKKEQHE